MTTLGMTRTLNGLIPADGESEEALRAIKVGTFVRVDVHRMRNAAFFRKWWALVRTGFGLWSEFAAMPTYQGEPVTPDFDRLRRDLVIPCGRYRAVANVRGEVRLEADSLKWGSMSEAEFEELYDRTLNVLLAKVLPPGVTDESRLREAADALLRFA